MALAAAWLVAMQTPHAGSAAAQQWTAAGNTREVSRMSGWTGLSHGAETLGSGLHAGPTEDKIGLFPWWDGRR